MLNMLLPSRLGFDDASSDQYGDVFVKKMPVFVKLNA
jgi:hypothetical protein